LGLGLGLGLGLHSRHWPHGQVSSRRHEKVRGLACPLIEPRAAPRSAAAAATAAAVRHERWRRPLAPKVAPAAEVAAARRGGSAVLGVVLGVGGAKCAPSAS
jgi:hypothetical protein